MLTLAVGLTLIGFVLLIFALMNANFALAIACIAVCVVGLLVLLYDTIRANKRGGAGVDDEPLFTIRGRESATRSAPLDDDAADGEATGVQAGGVDVTKDVATANEQATSSDDDAAWSAAGVAPTGGLGSIVSPDAHGAPVGADPTVDADAPVEETGDAHDYIRSVTGSFPAQTPTGEVPAQSVTPTGEVPAFETPAFETPAFETPAVEPTSEGVRDEDQPGYVGRRRRIEQSEGLVVNTADPTLPAMQFVFNDESSAPAADVPAAEDQSEQSEETSSSDDTDAR